MQPTTAARLAGAFAALAVALGALAAHALEGQLDARALAIFDKAVRYQMYHALGLGLCAALGHHGLRTGGAGPCFLAGIVLFSGSLYGHTLLGAGWLVHVTPFGGLSFVAGWVLLAAAGRRWQPS